MAKRPRNPKRSTAPAAAPINKREGDSASPRHFITSHWKLLLQALLIAGAALWIYWPALQGGWLWDDDLYVTGNPLLHDPARLWKIWFCPGSLVEYYPLEETFRWVQWQLWGDQTTGYHLTNVALHITGALLVWRLLSKLGLRLAWLGGLLFAIHPVQVESVAWIAEFKNALSLPPFLLAMIYWIDYEESGKRSRYYGALGWFLVAMLCKITVVLFPLVLLLYAWWKRGRTGWGDLKASAPFFLVSLVLGVINLLAAAWYLQAYPQPPRVIPIGGLLSRLDEVGTAAAFCLSKCVWPAGLLPMYPMWQVDPPEPLQFLPWVIFGGLMIWLWRERANWGRHVLLGLGFFLLTLAPCPGFLSPPNMNFSWVMDHFLYLPLVGLIGLAVAGMEKVKVGLPRVARLCGIAVAAIVMATLTWMSRGYAGLYINSETLWSHTFKQNPAAWPGHINLGKADLDAGRLPEAIEQISAALSTNPNSVEGHNDLGNAFFKMGRTAEAIDQYRKAIQLDPDYALAHTNLGNALLKTGQTSEAMMELDRALEIAPRNAEMHYNKGVALAAQQRIQDAMEEYEKALSINPNYADANDNLGLLLMQTGQYPEAEAHLERALRFDPNNLLAQNNLALDLVQMGRVSEGIAQYEQALRVKPDFVEALCNLGNAYYQTGRIPEAIAEYEAALQIKPDYPEAHNNLGTALRQLGRYSEAIAQYKEALRLNPAYADAQANLAQMQALPKSAPAKK